MTNSSEDFFDRLCRLRADCGDNKHDQAIALITACILEGLNTGRQIAGALATIGMDRDHVWITLRKNTGSDRARHYWRRDECGTYRLLKAAHALAA